MLADKELRALKNRLNDQIKITDIWHTKYKISLTFTKTNIMIINKHSKKSVSYVFTIGINEIKITRVHKVNCLVLL